MTDRPLALSDLAPPRPALRGALHSAALPAALAAGIVLVCLAPAGDARLAAAVYALSAVALFGASSAYHLGRWSERQRRVLRRLDHAGIHLIIAGTYTPFCLLALEGWRSVALLCGIWGAALAGIAMHSCWSRPPAWLATLFYVAMGWAAVAFLPELMAAAGIAAVVLAIVGGGLYTLGGLVYATRRPDPAPRVFGYHEVFHALTVAAFATQYVAVSLVVY